MSTIKAGCFVINKQNKTIALVHRERQNDYSFPKGHLEEGETIVECAIRETAEETKRKVEIIEALEPVIEEYTTPKGEQCKCYMYFAFDKGKSDNASWDTHDTLFVQFDDVENILTYPNLKATWNLIKDDILRLL